MLKRVCSVFDKAAAAYMNPFAVSALGLAIREFEDSVKNPQHPTPLSEHPSDFELWHIADFDDATGRFVPATEPMLICTGAQVVSGASS